MTIANGGSLDNASFVVPNRTGKQIHVVLEVTDDGTPTLTCYHQVIVRIEP